MKSLCSESELSKLLYDKLESLLKSSGTLLFLLVNTWSICKNLGTSLSRMHMCPLFTCYIKFNLHVKWWHKREEENFCKEFYEGFLHDVEELYKKGDASQVTSH